MRKRKEQRDDAGRLFYTPYKGYKGWQEVLAPTCPILEMGCRSVIKPISGVMAPPIFPIVSSCRPSIIIMSH